MEKKKRTLGENLRYLVARGWKIDKVIFRCCIGFTILNAIIPFISIFTPKILVAELLGKNRLEALLVILGVFFIISVITNYGKNHYECETEYRMVALRTGFMHDLERKCLKMDFKFTEDKDTLNKLNASFAAISNNEDGIEGIYRKLFALLGSIVAFVGYIAIVFTLNTIILIYLMANVLLVYYMTSKVKKYEYSKKDEIADGHRKVNYVYETMADFAYGKDIRIYGLSNWMVKKHKEFTEKCINIYTDIKNKEFKVLAVDTLLLLLREGVIYGYLVYRVFNGMAIDNFLMYFITIGGFATWMETIIKDIAHIRAQNLHINDFMDFIEMGDGSNEDGFEYMKIPESSSYEIEFTNVSFKYPNTERYIYRNLSLKIKSGQKLAIVGINGAGKTTFIKLLTRLYEPTTGEILLNGINIKHFNKEEYYELFSAVFQEIKMMAFSVAENVALKKKANIDRNRVTEVIEKADIGEKIFSLEKSIDTSLFKVLDDKGIELSGGQNQKLALARALYKNGDIIILDEPTAALDPISEYNTYLRFNELVGEKTAVYVSHRLASTRFCDVIAFFEEGEIKEYGTHDELIEMNGRYREMFDVQAQYYRNDVEKEGA